MSRDEELDVDQFARDSWHFRKRVVDFAPDEELPIDAGTWRDAIVFLQTGEVELECNAGECRRFKAGAVLCLVPPVSVVRNCGGDRAQLIAISRRMPGRPTRMG